VFIAAGYSLASILANILSCAPVAKAWDETITTGHCMNRPVFYFANAGLGIFTDFATVVVPMYVAPHKITVEVRLTNGLSRKTMAASFANAQAAKDCRQWYSGYGMFVS
jgi:hypothetical protein